MKVILVPQWLKKALEYANLNLATATDLKTLSTILSTEDVAKYIQFNNRCDFYVSEACSATFSGLSQGDLNGNVASDKHDKIANQLHYLNLKGLVSIDEGWLGRALAESEGYILSTQLVGSDTLIITPILGQAAADVKSDAIKFMDQLIGLWLSVTTLDQVASTPFFKAYLSLIKSV